MYRFFNINFSHISILDDKQNNGLHAIGDVHALVPVICEYVLYMQSGIKVADKIKVNNQVTSRWGNDLGLPGWAQCNHEAFKGGRGRSDTLSAIAGFEDGTGQQIKDVVGRF